MGAAETAKGIDGPVGPAEPTVQVYRGPDGSSPIRLTLEEQRRRMAAAREVVAAKEAIEDGPDEDDREFFRALDRSRPGGLDLGRYYLDGPDPA